METAIVEPMEIVGPTEEEIVLTWVKIDNLVRVVQISRSCVQKWCAERRFDARCARKIGKQWYFNLPLVKSEGLILKD